MICGWTRAVWPARYEKKTVTVRHPDIIVSDAERNFSTYEKKRKARVKIQIGPNSNNIERIE